MINREEEKIIDGLKKLSDDLCVLKGSAILSMNRRYVVEELIRLASDVCKIIRSENDAD